jgi:hypothetical protein
MNRRFSPMSEVNIMASLADLKEVDYKNLLLVTALMEMLIEKNIFTEEELKEKLKQLDHYPTSF